MLASDFDYPLPQDRIAQVPIEPRHSARLLDARTLRDHTFLELPSLLRAGDLVVVNETKVRHARLPGTKADTGGTVEVLLLGDEPGGVWEALIRPARRITVGTVIDFPTMRGEVVAGPHNGVIKIRLSSDIDIEVAIAISGQIPLPPYIHTPLDDSDRYQTVYAATPGSSAAPTAGLHFTPTVLAGLTTAGIHLATVELRVGMDTFRPIATESIQDHVMHSERLFVPAGTAEAVAECRHRGGRVVAIGTTSVRALETAARDDGTVKELSGSTSLYLQPGSPIRVVDLMVTNFHLPGSTLLVMLHAFMGPGWKQVYSTALERGYRFLSFGDAMLCARQL